jgi:small-conductance mechanosensitive channel
VSDPDAPAALDATWTAQLAAKAVDLGLRLVAAAVVLLILSGLYWLTRRAVRRALGRAAAHPNARLLIDRCVQFGFLFLAVTWMLSVMGVPLTAFVAVVGAISLAVSLALQDVLKNLVAGLIILVERPFTIGEHIDFRTFSGVVETIELRTTVLRTPTGQRVVIPNAMIFSDTLVNRSAYGRQLVRLRVTVPLEADGDGAGQPDGSGQERVAAEVLRAIRSTETGAGLGAETGGGDGAAAGVSRARGGAAGAGQPDGDAAKARREGRLGAPRTPGGAHPGGESPLPSVLVESLTKEKATLRVEAWAGDARDAVPRLAWALRRRIPGAEITVLE